MTAKQRTALEYLARVDSASPVQVHYAQRSGPLFDCSEKDAQRYGSAMCDRLSRHGWVDEIDGKYRITLEGRKALA